ncbi:MAG: Eukaryotic translation initiation factor eIF-1 [Cyphobasidiales sp. Tagirdzhanova-0007]|nr:MAG: Eukaryotic translation initiation factor eIF-1 [Cyphobasidiales sp. Tagirdzhanova-0007]
MSSTDTHTSNAASAPLENNKPSSAAKAAVEGKPPSADQLESLAEKLNITDATSDNDSRTGTPLPAEVPLDEVEKKKKKKLTTKSSKETSSRTADSKAGSKVQNLATFDPFADADEIQTQDALEKSTKAPEYVHIRLQQRNGRKTLSTIQGIPTEYDNKKLLKFFRKEFACNGTLVLDEELGDIIQLQGDHRVKINQKLVEEVGLPADTIKLHGF